MSSLDDGVIELTNLYLPPRSGRYFLCQMETIPIDEFPELISRFIELEPVTANRALVIVEGVSNSILIDPLDRTIPAVIGPDLAHL